MLSPLFTKLVRPGTLTLVCGKPGSGMSSLVAWLAAQARHCVYCHDASESSVRTVLPRLQANGANLECVSVILADDRPCDEQGEVLHSACQKAQADLVVVDSAESCIGDETESPDSAHVRSSLMALVLLAELTGAAVVATHHVSGLRNHSLPGSVLWMSIPRTIAYLGASPYDDEDRSCRFLKCSFSPTLPAVAFRLVRARTGQPPLFVPRVDPGPVGATN